MKKFWYEANQESKIGTPRIMNNIILHYANKADVLHPLDLRRESQTIPSVCIKFGKYGETQITDLEWFQETSMVYSPNFYLTAPKMLMCEAPLFSATPDAVVIPKDKKQKNLLTKRLFPLINEDYKNVAFFDEILTNPEFQIIGSMECKTTRIDSSNDVQPSISRAGLIEKVYGIAESDQPLGKNLDQVLTVLQKHKGTSMTKNNMNNEGYTLQNAYGILDDARLDVRVYSYGEPGEKETEVTFFSYKNVRRDSGAWLNLKGSGNNIGGQGFAGLLCTASSLLRSRPENGLPREMKFVFILVLLDYFLNTDEPNGGPERVVLVIESEYTFPGCAIEKILLSIKEKTYQQGQLLCKTDDLVPDDTARGIEEDPREKRKLNQRALEQALKRQCRRLDHTEWKES